jgi:hypothetical protein
MRRTNSRVNRSQDHLRGKRKAGPLWEGEIQRAPGLTINRIVLSGRTRAHTPFGVSFMPGDYVRGCWRGAKSFIVSNPVND